MEYALRLGGLLFSAVLNGEVLILVLMEYALRLSTKRAAHSKRSLNPCFNGICSAIQVGMLLFGATLTSLNPCFNGICSAIR